MLNGDTYYTPKAEAIKNLESCDQSNIGWIKVSAFNHLISAQRPPMAWQAWAARAGATWPEDAVLLKFQPR
jgi:hypothetical protein